MSDSLFPSLRSNTISVPSVETTACGKAIIVGEHAAVYGSHAVAIPLHQMRFRFHLTQKALRPGQSPEVHLKLAGHEGSPRLQAVVLKAMHLLEIEPFSLDAETHSTLPIGAGLGSSATLCVAVLRALSQALQVPLSPYRLAHLANELEKSFHGNPSGLDTAVVAFEEPVLFVRGLKIDRIPLTEASQFDFVLIDSNIRASTMAMIRIAEPYFKAAEGDRRIARFDSLSLAAYECLKNGDMRTLADTMNECGGLLSEAGVVPENLQDMIVRARERGALAAKSTGAGGGGMIIGLLPRENTELRYQQLKEEFHGHPVYRVTLSGNS